MLKELKVKMLICSIIIGILGGTVMLIPAVLLSPPPWSGMGYWIISAAYTASILYCIFDCFFMSMLIHKENYTYFGKDYVLEFEKVVRTKGICKMLREKWIKKYGLGKRNN